MADARVVRVTTCDEGDWYVLEYNSDKPFRRSGHTISVWDWLDLLKHLGYATELKRISDEEMLMNP